MSKRFGAINAEHDLRGRAADRFAARAAEHLNELNAIHPFLDGNGRAQRAFLEIPAERAGHEIDLARVEPTAWNQASSKVSTSRITNRYARRSRARFSAAAAAAERMPYLAGATRPNIAPCGSSACTTHCPPGTSCGPLSTFPPAAVTRAAAASARSTLM
jgi:hypothetical protein